MNLQLFITATDTDAGKTVIGQAILIAAGMSGSTVSGYKPIESGCQAIGQPGPDAISLAQAISFSTQYSSTSPSTEDTSDDLSSNAFTENFPFLRPPAPTAIQTSYNLLRPIGPWKSAQLQGIDISIKDIHTKAKYLKASHDVLIIEGAGGLMVPLNPKLTILDLTETLSIPILIVVPDVLGSINLTLLTILAAKSRNLKVQGIILNKNSRDTSQNLYNFEQIQAHTSVPVFQFPFIESTRQLIASGQKLIRFLLDK